METPRLILALAFVAYVTGVTDATKDTGPPAGAPIGFPLGPEYPPPSGSYGPVAPVAYRAPYVDAGYRYAPLAINTPFDAPAGFDEIHGSESKYHLLPVPSGSFWFLLSLVLLSNTSIT